MIKLRFFGAAMEVTGSCYLLTIGSETLLIDCGLFQGGKESYLRNYNDFAFDPAKIDHLILTHAHVDHSGRLPLMERHGFNGVIHAHSATCDLAQIILLDSAHIQQVEAAWRSKKNMRRGEGRVEPLYSMGDAERVLNRFERHHYHEPIKISDHISVTLHDAGHILGSSIAEITIRRSDKPDVTIVISGDLGKRGQPIINDPDRLSHADFLVMESTYGGRLHQNIDSSKDELAAIFKEAATTGGTVIIPSFAIGRTQELLYYIRELFDEGKVPAPFQHVYVDSPMAVRATGVYEKALRECYDQNARDQLDKNGSPINFNGLRFVESVEESTLLNMQPGGSIIISAAGMCDAGRVLHHLRHNLWNPKSHIVFVGYQAVGTKGRKIVEGQEVVKIMREEITVKAKIHSIGGFSAHADSQELIDWAGAFKTAPTLTMVCHGEPEQAAALKESLANQLGFKCTIPSPGEEIYLTE